MGGKRACVNVSGRVLLLLRLLLMMLRLRMGLASSIPVTQVEDEVLRCNKFDRRVRLPLPSIPLSLAAWHCQALHLHRCHHLRDHKSRGYQGIAPSGR